MVPSSSDVDHQFDHQSRLIEKSPHRTGPYIQNPQHLRDVGLGAEALLLLGDPHLRSEQMVPAEIDTPSMDVTQC